MGDHDMTPRRAPEAVLVALAEAADAWYGETAEEQPGWCDESKAMFKAMHAYRAAVAPLRTRAEVDAEIVTLLRDYHRYMTRPGHKEKCAWDSFSVGEKNDLNRLCCEPTADETERAQPAECEWCQDSTQPQLHQYRIPESIVRVCTRCLEERGLAAKVKP